MKHKHAMSLVRVGSTIVVFAMTSCAQLPSTAATESAMFCPAYTADPEANWAAPVPACRPNPRWLASGDQSDTAETHQ